MTEYRDSKPADFRTMAFVFAIVFPPLGLLAGIYLLVRGSTEDGKRVIGISLAIALLWFLVVSFVVL